MAKKKKSEPEAVASEAKPAPEPKPAPEAATASLYRPLQQPAAAKPAPGPDAPVTLAADVSLDGSANAPFIYFENAGVSGHMNGLVRVTLEANRLLPGENNKVFVDRVIVGHLRMNIPAAQSLRNALDRALLIASKPATEKLN